MKKTLIAMAVLGAASGFAMAASNVTLYGIVETGVLMTKAKDTANTVEMVSGFDSGSRWGIKGTEDLGNGYSVGFILEQGFSGDTGAAADKEKQFSRESILNVKGGFGSLAWGRTGTLSSGAQSQHILTGYALGTGYGLSAWTSLGTSFSRADNAVSYVSPKFGGFTVHAMYSNKTAGNDGKDQWSKNNHYYGVGVKYQEAGIKSSLIFETTDAKDAEEGKKNATYVVNYGVEYDMGSVTPMFAYQFATKNKGDQTHMFGLSAKVAVGGGDALIGARYIFGEENYNTDEEQDVSAWNVGAAYVYPLSKRTSIKAYAGYADSDDAWKNKNTNKDGDTTAAYNGYQVFLGMKHSF